MLYFDRIEVSEGIDINKTSASKECDMFDFWYFLNCSFKFHSNVCNRCHDLLIMSMNLSNVAVLNMKASYCHCIISSIIKNETINLMQNVDLTEKMEHYKTNILFSYIKMVKETARFGNIKIENNKFYRHKTPIILGDVDIEKVVISNKISFRRKL